MSRPILRSNPSPIFLRHRRVRMSIQAKPIQFPSFRYIAGSLLAHVVQAGSAKRAGIFFLLLGHETGPWPASSPVRSTASGMVAAADVVVDAAAGVSSCGNTGSLTVLHPITTLGTTTPTGLHWHALVIEIIVTFNMMFVTCAVATYSRAVGELAGLAVGAAVCITSIFAGPVSGGSMNPARTLAPAVASGVYTGLWIYFLGHVIGTLSGAWVYTYIRFEEAPSMKDGPQKLSSFKLRRLQSQRSMAADDFDHV